LTSTFVTISGSCQYGVLAMRLKGFRSWGPTPDFLYFGGNSEMRGYEYLQFLGHKAFFADVELRYPLVEAMLTPFGVLGGLRGVLFFNLGGSGFNNANFNAFETGTDTGAAAARLHL
jgi:outer membrane protein assembly factor BamA